MKPYEIKKQMYQLAAANHGIYLDTLKGSIILKVGDHRYRYLWTILNRRARLLAQKSYNRILT